MAVSRLVIYPYKMGSKSAKILAQRITMILRNRVRRVKVDGIYRPTHRSFILNWGNREIPFWEWTGQWINNTRNVALASNKADAFQMFKNAGIPTPDWTTDVSVAQGWLNEDHIVLSRTLLTSHSGRGIIINNSKESNKIVRAPLYVKYKKKRKEFRVHVFNGQIIDLIEKRKFRVARRPETYTNFIRTYINGWVFCRDLVVEPSELRQLALDSVAALGLNLGACDIIWNEKENKCYTLEVNTAPGLEGTTLERYSQAIASYVTNSI